MEGTDTAEPVSAPGSAMDGFEGTAAMPAALRADLLPPVADPAGIPGGNGGGRRHGWIPRGRYGAGRR